MRYIKYIISIFLALSLQGCFFILIPGSVVGYVGDSITGSEGKNCVSSDVKIGDKVKMVDGSFGTVKSLSGTSRLCRTEQNPVRALVIPDSAEKQY